MVSKTMFASLVILTFAMNACSTTNRLHKENTGNLPTAVADDLQDDGRTTDLNSISHGDKTRSISVSLHDQPSFVEGVRMRADLFVSLHDRFLDLGDIELGIAFSNSSERSVFVELFSTKSHLVFFDRAGEVIPQGPGPAPRIEEVPPGYHWMGGYFIESIISQSLFNELKEVRVKGSIEVFADSECTDLVGRIETATLRVRLQ